MRRAFSLVETIVVIVILAILAGVVVPRMAGGAARRAELETRAVADLLDILAARDALSASPLALLEDPARKELTIWSWRPGRDPEAPADWAPLPTVRPVVLNECALRSVAIDGALLPQGQFRVELQPGQARPSISVLLVQNSDPDGAAWQIDLPAGELAPRVRGLTSPGLFRPAEPAGIDLDAAGRRNAPW
jgi:prepilin-type N-terminal cleavage/methylation domain-containing protein